MTVAEIIEKAIRDAGSEAKLAAKLGCTQPAVNGMRRAGRVSAEMAVKLEEAMGIDRHDLRPDLWPSPFITQDGTRPRARAHARGAA